MKRLVFFGLVVLISSSVVFASHFDELLQAADPIIYGQKQFQSRIDSSSAHSPSVGLVLSGGSARAFAHVGVLMALEEMDIVPDFIISNSMGSIVGILYAAGISPKQILNLITQFDIAQLFDLTFPLQGGLLDASRFLSALELLLGKGTRIEELPIPIMIVCEDLVSKRQVHITEGDAITVMEAAFALPFYFTPVAYEGHLLVDGGITNIVPLSIAYDYADTIIVSTTFYEGQGISLKNSLSILNVSIDIGKRRAGVKELIEHPQAIWIRCDVEQFSFMDFSAAKQLSVRGYESALKHADELSVLPRNLAAKEFAPLRKEYQKRLEKLLSSYTLYQQLPVRNYSQQLFAGIRSFSDPSMQWFLRDEALMGLYYRSRWDRFLFSIHAGAGWKTYSPMDIWKEAAFTFTYNPIDELLLEADVIIDDQLAIDYPDVYYRLGFHLRKHLFSKNVTAAVLGWWEQQYHSDFTKQKEIIHTGIELILDSDPLWVQFDVGYQSSENFGRHFFYAKADTKVPLTGDLFLQGGYTGRYALDNKSPVPIYWADGFVSTVNKEVVESQNLSIGKVQLSWQPEHFKPTFGELLIFENSTIGLFGNFLFSDSYADYVTGMSVGTTGSLLGLSSIEATVFAGYEGSSRSIVWGFMFKR
ncbi:MAG: patatin-like phospholipase family protein [Sphaerochaetaceae bacterium]